MKYLTLILASLLFASCSHTTDTARKNSGRYPAQSREPKGPMAEIPPSQILTFEKLKQNLLTTKVGSIQDALPHLTRSYLEYFKFHTLGYASLSLHQSSFVEPRAIVFGPDARFILTFNGDDRHAAGSSFETVEYSNQSRSFLFREVTFKGPRFRKKSLGLDPNEIEFENEQLVISKPNPKKCLQCHGPTASPIWMTYFIWPGFYGSNDDHLYMSFDKSSWNPNNEKLFANTDRPHSLGRVAMLKPGFADREVEGYIKYLERKSTHPRYKWLPEHVVDQSYLRFANGEKFSALDRSGQANTEQSRVNAYYAWPTRPNLFLQEALQRLNQDRLISVLQKAGLEKAFKNQAWDTLGDQISNPQELNSVKYLARISHEALQKFKFKTRAPSLQEVEARLILNLRDEIGMHRERINLLEQGFGKNSLMLDRADYGGREGIADPEAFYSKLLGLSEISDKDRIAFAMESDNQIVLTVLEFLLKDQGIELSQYNMNLRSSGLTFHSGGLAEVGEFLGVGSWVN